MTDRNIRVQKVFVSRVLRFRNTYLSWGFLQVEAEEVGRDVADLHGLSFTLQSGLFTPLQGKMKRVLWGRGSLDKVLLLEKRSWQYIHLHILKHKHVHITDTELKRSRPNTSGTKMKEFRRMFFIFFYIDLDKITGFTGRFWIFSTGRKDLEILEITDLLVKFEWLLILCVLILRHRSIQTASRHKTSWETWRQPVFISPLETDWMTFVESCCSWVKTDPVAATIKPRGDSLMSLYFENHPDECGSFKILKV